MADLERQSGAALVAHHGESRTRILVVEDEQIVACDIAEMLVGLGYLVIDIVATGEAAVETTRTHHPDAILMDIRLAGAMDGIEAAARIRAEQNLPVIYLTAHTDDDTLRRAQATEPLGYLLKPFRETELCCAIAIAIRRHEVDTRLRVREQWLTATLRSIGEGEVVGGVMVFRNANDQRRIDAELHHLNAEFERRVAERTEQLEAANRELEAFSYSVAHDLRAPLRSIDGFSQVLIEDHAVDLGPHGVEQLHRVRGATARMGQLIDDLLQLSRVAAIELRQQSVNLSRLAHAVTDTLRRGYPGRVVEVEIQGDLVLEADERLLRIVLENLLGNAWKFTSKTACARIEVGAHDQGATRAYFVRDNGVGFNLGCAHKLFGAFQRFHTAGEFEGNGVGLAIAQRIIHRLGGRIWAESAVAGGSTFYFAIQGTEGTSPGAGA
jgi:signal transduction histidine kinase